MSVKFEKCCMYTSLTLVCCSGKSRFFFLVFFRSGFIFYRKSEVINNFCSCGPFFELGSVFESPEHTGSESVVVLCVG